MLEGIIPVLPTPFVPDGAIDIDAMGRLVDFALGAGVAGIAYPGFASEVTHLDADERAILLRTVSERVAGRVPLVAGASGASLDDIIRHGREALEVGITNLMIQAPNSVGDRSADVTEFFLGVARALPAATLMLQNAPPPRGVELSAQTTLAVVASVESLAYVKQESLPSVGPISELLSSPPRNLKGVLGGGGARYIFDEYRRGACGTMPAVELADLHVEFDAAYRSGKLECARRLYVESLPLLTLQTMYRMRLTKRVLMLRGVLGNDFTRAPAPDFDPQGIEEIEEWLDVLSPHLRLGRSVNVVAEVRA